MSDSELMEDWVECELGEVCNINMGQSPPSSTYNTERIGLPFFQGKAEFTELFPIVKKWCSKPKKIAHTNDILLSVRAPVGSTNIANQECAIGRGLASISFKYSNTYLWFYLKSIEQKLNNQGTGTTFKAISGNVLKYQILPLPPLPIQRAIVSKIEGLFSDLDSGIADLKKAQDQLKIYRQAVLKKAFEGELTKEWREQQSDLPTAEELLAQIKEERERHYSQQLEDWKKAVEDWEENGKVGKKPGKPRELKEIKINESRIQNLNWLYIFSEYVCDFITKGTTPAKLELFERTGDIPFLKVYNLTFTGKLDFSINPTFVNKETHEGVLNRSIVFPYDVLMNIVGPPLGKVSLVPKTYTEWNINQAIVRMRPYSFLSPEYLTNYLLLQLTIHKISKRAKATAGQFNLTLEICREIEIPLCSLPEQHQIVREIESRLSVCDKVEESISQGLKKAEVLRQSILKKAFEGKLLRSAEIEKCKAEADYEPASVLLERIRAEKVK